MLSDGQVNDAFANIGMTPTAQQVQQYANDPSYDGVNGQIALMQKLSPSGYSNYQQTQATQNYQNATNTAVQGLQQKKTDLAGQYSDLLKTVTGEYQPLINQTTATAGAALAQRGLTPDSQLFQQQTQGALQPIYGQETANAQTIGQGSISDTNTLAQAISNLQAGAAGTASQLPLQYGSLSLSQQALPTSLALGSAQAASANTSANYIAIPNLGIYDLSTKKIISGLGQNGGGAATGSSPNITFNQ